MRKSKKIIVLLSALMAVMLSFTACASGKTQPGDGGKGERPAGSKVVIYTGGASEFTWVKGTEEDAVIEYIEQKYYEETGNSIDFTVAYLGEDMKTKLSAEIAAGGQVDIAVSFNRGNGNGIDEWAIANDMYYDVGDMMYDYAPNLYDAVEGTPLDSLTTSDNKVVGIPSVVNPYKFGILVRKDYMEQCGYTDDPEKAKTEFSAGRNYELVDNIQTFEAMCQAINGITGQSYAVTGGIWDIEKTFLGAFAHTSYFSNGYIDTDGDGNGDTIMFGGAATEYGGMLELEYRWAKNGVISVESNSIQLEQAEANFISGKTGVFVQDPTVTHLIEVARKTKAANAQAEFTVLGPLKATKDSPDDQKGFMRNAQAAFGAVILKSSTKTRDIMKFLNWVYKNEDNYNLCRYGIEGEHWVNNGDGTYSFPAGKEEYLTRKPYSGILTLVENQNMSNLIYDGYSEEEMRWITEIAGDKNNYVENDVVDYLFTNNEAMQRTRNAAFVKIHTPAKECWTGQTDPSEFDSVAQMTKFEMWAHQYKTSSGMSDLFKLWTDEYLLMKAARSAKG